MVADEYGYAYLSTKNGISWSVDYEVWPDMKDSILVMLDMFIMPLQ